MLGVLNQDVSGISIPLMSQQVNGPLSRQHLAQDVEVRLLLSRNWEARTSSYVLQVSDTVVFCAVPDYMRLFLSKGFAGYQLGSDNLLDVYNIAANTWSSTVPEADPSYGRPGPRSVHGLVGFQSAKFPNARAVLYHGESEASDLGHAGAGSFWSDVWFLEEKSTGAETLHWKCVLVEGAGPAGRGWFPSAAWTDEGETKVILQGGLLSSNERSDELWSLEVV